MLEFLGCFFATLQKHVNAQVALAQHRGPTRTPRNSTSPDAQLAEMKEKSREFRGRVILQGP